MKTLVTWAVGVAATLAPLSAFSQAYLAPSGGWTYWFDGNAATAGADNSGWSSLDGFWNHDNGSDAWAKDGLGEPFVNAPPGGNPPGGVMTTDGYLRLQDTGDPRDYGFGESNVGGNAGSVGSNRKIYFGRNITDLGASPTVLNDGVTLSFRARVPTSGLLDPLHPDGGGGVTPYPADGDGYGIHDGGKGNFGIRQGAGGIISFSLGTAADPGGAPGLRMNNLNGSVLTGDVDSGEAGLANLLALDPTAWHEFWITIQQGGAGTHQVRIYMDGVLSPTLFDVTAGTGVESQFGTGTSYLALGVGSTGQSGALDVDFFGFALGVFEPVPEPSLWALLALGGLALWAVRRQRA